MFHIRPWQAIAYAFTAPDSRNLLAVLGLTAAAGATYAYAYPTFDHYFFAACFISALALVLMGVVLVSGYKLCYAMRGRMVVAAQRRSWLSGIGLGAGAAAFGSSAQGAFPDDNAPLHHFPAMNIDGTPMIDGTMMDIKGNAFGTMDPPDMGSGMGSGSFDSYNSPHGM